MKENLRIGKWLSSLGWLPAAGAAGELATSSPSCYDPRVPKAASTANGKDSPTPPAAAFVGEFGSSTTRSARGGPYQVLARNACYRVFCGCLATSIRGDERTGETNLRAALKSQGGPRVGQKFTAGFTLGVA